jgi:hypothetical protein
MAAIRFVHLLRSFLFVALQVKEGDLRGLFEGLGIKAVRIGMDRETGQSRVSNRGRGAAG